jgi:hypothetical protein
MDELDITHYITSTFANVETAINFGYTFFFYGSDHMLPFVTLAVEDNDYDRVSNLDRPGVFRLNIGVSKQTFQSLFGAGRVDISGYDFTVLDTILPHPDYAPQSFICVLNPSDATFQKIQLYLAEAYEIARKRSTRRKAD